MLDGTNNGKPVPSGKSQSVDDDNDENTATKTTVSDID